MMVWWRLVVDIGLHNKTKSLSKSQISISCSEDIICLLSHCEQKEFKVGCVKTAVKRLAFTGRNTLRIWASKSLYWLNIRGFPQYSQRKANRFYSLHSHSDSSFYWLSFCMPFRVAWRIQLIFSLFSLWPYSPILGLGRLHETFRFIPLVDLGQSAGLLGRVISS
jgi:hypothetical protein